MNRTNAVGKPHRRNAPGRPSNRRRIEGSSGKRIFRIFSAIVLFLLAQPLRGDDWPQWRGPNRDGVWNESGVLEKFPDPQLKISWRAPIGSGYCGPTVAKGRVYVMDRQTRPTQVERRLLF